MHAHAVIWTRQDSEYLGTTLKSLGQVQDDMWALDQLEGCRQDVTKLLQINLELRGVNVHGHRGAHDDDSQGKIVSIAKARKPSRNR